MDLSGIIFVVLAIVWAVYLIPQVLKRHDEVARTRSIDRFSTAVRVLARREPVDRHDSRLVVIPVRPAVTGVLPVPATDPVVRRPAVRRTAARVAARAAARRRRRILVALLGLDVLTAAAAYLGYVPRWAVTVPVGLTVLFVVLCRTQVRHERARDVAVPPKRAEAVDQPLPEVGEVGEVGEVTEFDETEDTVGIAVADLQPALEREDSSVAPGNAASVWDPLPVTLPTYVTKAKAPRTVRTIELGEPGTWTSGRTPEDAEIAARATEAASAPKAGPTGDGQQAVGS